MKELKDKIIKDQKLLLRNNEELETEIEQKRNGKNGNDKLSKLKIEARKMR